jgi:hypothetical protein
LRGPGLTRDKLIINENSKLKEKIRIGKIMAEANRNKFNLQDNKTLIIAVVVVVLVVIFMYIHDQNQQRAFDLQRLERRVELLEEWGISRRNM